MTHSTTTSTTTDLKNSFLARLKKYPDDRLYYMELAKNLKLKEGDEYRLYSIMGGAELKALLTKATPRDFQSDTIYPKLHDPKLKLNLHTHTDASDGLISAENWLTYMTNYANLSAEKLPPLGADSLPFLTAAITDHDSIANTFAVLKLLISAPEKYQNLRVVLGSELSAVYRNKATLRNPLTFEIIYYCLNPFDKGLQRLITSITEGRQRALPILVGDLNKKLGVTDLSAAELTLIPSLLSKGQSLFLTFGIYYHYLHEKHPEKITPELKEYIFALDNKKGFKIHQDLDDIFTVWKQSGFGFLGMAHPARTPVGDSLSFAFITKCQQKGKDAGREVITSLLSLLASKGLAAAETNYQNFSGDLATFNRQLQSGEMPSDTNNPTYLWLKAIKEQVQAHHLLEAGGFDTHRYFIF